MFYSALYNSSSLAAPFPSLYKVEAVMSFLSNPRRVAILGSVAGLLAITSAQSTGSDECTGVHIFLSRGNNEPYPGRQGKLVDAICSELDNCDYEDIVFDNALEREYCAAVEEGRSAGVKQITAYNKRCPDTKLVVSGYSQGAQVVGDILGGGGGVFFQDCTTPDTAAMDPKSKPGNMIKAALLFGDTRHTASQSYNILEGAGANGLFPRGGEQLAGLNGFSDVLRAWCQGGDPVCAQGDTVAEHLNYFDIFPPSAAEWVSSVVGEVAEPSSTQTTTTKASPTTKSTSTEASSTSAETSRTPTTSTMDVSTSKSTSASSNPTSMASASSRLPEGTAPTENSEPSPTSGDSGASTVRCLSGLASLAALGSAFLLVL
ncbi:carbohydrate esterase family 5 protein [Astrocystis sublimbata]|nr:carbohydrate esterase family 5 protein [Astrocystis sublimbata]